MNLCFWLLHPLFEISYTYDLVCFPGCVNLFGYFPQQNFSVFWSRMRDLFHSHVPKGTKPISSECAGLNISSALFGYELCAYAIKPIFWVVKNFHNNLRKGICQLFITHAWISCALWTNIFTRKSFGLFWPVYLNDLTSVIRFFPTSVTNITYV